MLSGSGHGRLILAGDEKGRGGKELPFGGQAQRQGRLVLAVRETECGGKDFSSGGQAWLVLAPGRVVWGVIVGVGQWTRVASFVSRVVSNVLLSSLYRRWSRRRKGAGLLSPRETLARRRAILMGGKENGVRGFAGGLEAEGVVLSCLVWRSRNLVVSRRTLAVAVVLLCSRCRGEGRHVVITSSATMWSAMPRW